MTKVSDRPIVWIVDAEQWPRALLRAELMERGCEAVGYLTLETALAALRGPGLRKPRLLVLELRGQTVTSENLKELREADLPIVLTGGALELQQFEIRSCTPAAVMRRPVTIGEIADTAGKILGAGPAAVAEPPDGRD